MAYRSVLDADGKARRSLPPVQDADEAALLRRAYQDRALGRSLNDIAIEWNVRGVRPRSVRGVDRFGRQTVASILGNPFYMGSVQHLGELRAGHHEPIVTEAEWWAAQRPKTRVTRRQWPPLLLQGVADCAGCGRPVYPSRPRKGPQHSNEHYSYYREPSRDTNRACPDAGQLWSSEDVDAIVEEVVRSMTMSPEWLDFVSDEAAKLPAQSQDQRRQLENRVRRIQKEYFREHLEENEYLRLRREADSELALLPAARPELERVGQRFASFGALWDGASAETKNETCRVIFDSVTLDMRAQTLAIIPAAEFEPLFQLRRSLHVQSISPERG